MYYTWLLYIVIQNITVNLFIPFSQKLSQTKKKKIKENKFKWFIYLHKEKNHLPT